MIRKGFVLPSMNRKLSNNQHGEVVRIKCDSYNLLVEMSNESGIPIGKIAGACIQYAYENLEYDVHEEDEK